MKKVRWGLTQRRLGQRCAIATAFALPCQSNHPLARTLLPQSSHVEMNATVLVRFLCEHSKGSDGDRGYSFLGCHALACNQCGVRPAAPVIYFYQSKLEEFPLASPHGIGYYYFSQASLAQSVEHRSRKAGVISSSLITGSSDFYDQGTTYPDFFGPKFALTLDTMSCVSFAALPVRYNDAIRDRSLSRGRPREAPVPD